MSKLPKAPLVEVIFEIRWQIINQKDIVDYQYLHGDLYSVIKDKFPVRENLLPAEIPLEVAKGVPAYRFRRSSKGYPLIQLGLGLLTLNTTDDTYYWENFENEINYILDSFVQTYPKSKELNFTPSLTYVDFFEINFEQTNPIDFINEKFNLKIDQNFLDKDKIDSREVNLDLSYKLGDNVLNLSLKNGTYNDNKKGVVLQTKIFGKNEIYSRESLSVWINESHYTTSKIFKDLIKEDFYKTFK